MSALSPKVLREIRQFLLEHGDDYWETTRWTDAIDLALKPKRSAAPARKRREAKKATRREKTASVRAEVATRAMGKCESCGSDLMPVEMDHFRGGSHKRSNETVQGCWMLCRACHRAKTDSEPSRLHWLGRFREHCLKHGYTREARETERLMDALYLSSKSREVLP